MSKNSAIQKYECLKSYIQVLEGKRKKKEVTKLRNEKIYTTKNAYRSEY